MVRRFTAVSTVLAVAFAGAAGVASATPPDEKQVLFFNHAYGVLDRETADAIEHSDFLREFANFQVRTTTGSGGETWTGRYLMGRETYLELFGVGDLPGQDGTLGSGGLGVSVERAGDLTTVLDRLRAEGITPVEFQQTRDFGDGVPVPWFDAVFTSETYDAFGAWAMEYEQTYLDDPRSDTEPASYPGDVGRERYLSDDYRKHLMREVIGIRLAVTEQDLANTAPLLRAGGFTVEPTPDGGIVARRGGTTMWFDVAPRDQVGLREVDLALNWPVLLPHEERIGHSTLVVGPGSTATWTFGD
jgi:uncharacterized protein DUF5829